MRLCRQTVGNIIISISLCATHKSGPSWESTLLPFHLSFPRLPSSTKPNNTKQKGSATLAGDLRHALDHFNAFLFGRIEPPGRWQEAGNNRWSCGSKTPSFQATKERLLAYWPTGPIAGLAWVEEDLSSPALALLTARCAKNVQTTKSKSRLLLRCQNNFVNPQHRHVLPSKPMTGPSIHDQLASKGSGRRR